MHTRLSNVLVLAFCVSLASACGGGSIYSAPTGTGSPGTGTGTGGGSTPAPTPVPAVGTRTNSTTFTPGALFVGVAPPSNLSAGGSSSLRLDIVDTNASNALLTGTSVSVAFTSDCVAAGRAEIAASPVVTSTGVATATYVDKGCGVSTSGTLDTITATATIGSSNYVATGTISVLPSSLGSLQFISATPAVIGLRGSGQPETSAVKFQLVNSANGGVAGRTVNFSLQTAAGGITIGPADGTPTTDSAITDSNGFVQTNVNSGTVHTSVVVTASIVDTSVTPNRTISSESSGPVINAGPADQDSFSLSANCFNVEALGVDGAQVQLTIRAGDRFNNTVKDGTPISFTTEGGVIQIGSCTTVDGACSVTWTSQDPRPIAYAGCANGSDAACAEGAGGGTGFRAGRSTVLATAVGEESFTDSGVAGVAGNGLYDDGEPFTELGDPFLDKNGNLAFDGGIDELLNTDNNGSYDPPVAMGSALYTGSRCAGPVRCDPVQSLYVRDELVIVMSGSAPVIAPATDITVVGGTYSTMTNTFTFPDGGFGSIFFVVRDVNDQPMPSGTTVSVSSTGDAGSFVGTTSFTVPCTTNDNAAANLYGFSFKAADVTGPKSGAIELKVTTPKLTTTLGFGVATTFVPQCNDSLDNDSDGLVDFPADPECTGTGDDNEAL